MTTSATSGASLDPTIAEVQSFITELQGSLGSLQERLQSLGSDLSFSKLLAGVEMGGSSGAPGSSVQTQPPPAMGAPWSGYGTDMQLGLLGSGATGGSAGSSELQSMALPVGAVMGASGSTSPEEASAELAALGAPAALVPVFEQASAKTGVSVALLASIAKAESGFDPAALSSAGAEGIMQLMPGTASSLGVNPYDPVQAVVGAGQFLAGLIGKFGSVPLAVAAYNAGPGAVEQYGGIPPYSQTQSYVKEVMGYLSQAVNAAQGGSAGSVVGA